MALKLKLANGKEALKEYSETITLGDYSDYRKSLKVLQKNVNEYLSALVASESGKKQAQHPTCGRPIEKTLLASDSEGSDLEEAPSKRALSRDRELHRPKAHKKAKEQ